MSTVAELKPAYLVAGADGAKIDAALARLRARAEREGGPGALESFSPPDGQGPPDPEALLGALPAMSLMATRRYLLADGVQQWSAAQAERVAEGLAELPAETTVVLVARLDPGAGAQDRSRAKRALAPLERAVKAAGGQSLSYEAPKARALPGWLVEEAKRRGLGLSADAARLLVERMGESTVRLANELDRLALWAGGGEVTAADLEAMVADTSEEVVWALSDAVVARDRPQALATAERLAGQGESVTPLIYQAAKRLREARAILASLEAGGSESDAAAAVRMHPYAAKMLARRVRGTSPEDLRAATCAVADLEWWTRGGADYPEEVALTLALRRAIRAGAGGS